MKRKFIWLFVSSITVLVLLAASCAPAKEAAPAPTVKEVAPAVKEVAPAVVEAKPAEVKDTVKVKLTKVDGTVVEKLLEKPKYGGTLTISGLADNFDPTTQVQWRTGSVHRTHSKLVIGDWTKGGSGTGEASFWPTVYYPPFLLAPELAEGWELPDDETIIYHLRKGARFHNRPPANGREVTADDVVFSMKRHFELPTSYLYITIPAEQRPVSVTAKDKYTVEVKASPKLISAELHRWIGGYVFTYPPEVFKQYGNITDWKNAIGTGPFEITDYVAMSSMTFRRNPNYFLNDPLYLPENKYQLPYIDQLITLSIPDVSTTQAAFRTYKIDESGASLENFESQLRSNPNIGFMKRNPTSPYLLGMRLDKPELPFKDIRVRRALNMALDRKTIINDLYKGDAEIVGWPIIPMKEYSDIFIPLEKHSASIQEYFSYNPEKAKQLLAEAGYPKGFKTNVAVSSSAALIDMLSLFKACFSAINVDMEIKTYETAVYTAIETGRTHEQMLYRYTASSDPLALWEVHPLRGHNASMVNDPFINQMISEMQRLANKETERRQLYKEKALPYILEQAYYVLPPAAYSYTIWHPWVKNYNSESSIGIGHYGTWPIFIWIDQDLKKSLTGKS